MAKIRPFQAWMPRADLAEQVAALPYDVYSRAEAREKVQGDQLSFLRIDRPETQFEEDCDMYAPRIYEKADEMLKQMEHDGILVQDEKPLFYIYELTMDGRTQTGLVAGSSVDDYLTGVVKKHEQTRRDKEEDRVRHVDGCSAQTGPIFLAYRANPKVKEILEQAKQQTPYCSFTPEDGVYNCIWKITDEDMIRQLTELFEEMEYTYIADGHHRAASAVRVSQMRRAARENYTGEEEFNFFLSVLFADEELKIMDYNRVLKSRNGLGAEELLDKLKEVFRIEPVKGENCRPSQKGEMGFYQDHQWYRLQVKEEYCKQDPVNSLDVAYLQREVLTPVFGIKDPKTDGRIDFVGGIRGLQELERRCDQDCVCAFAMYPTAIEELFAVADADLLMPPKSTWFEPKLRSGLFIHEIER
ncbi:MAG: DUF1015 family protein [Lachnospiraceae bacterium]|nr:DUF1015 family protein [Lachnospiraceae bacterium]